MQTITYEQLKSLLNDGKVHLINVLPEESYQKMHIPGSINIPREDPYFSAKVKTMVGGSPLPIVLYCAGPECDASRKAHTQLEQAKVANVLVYEGGMKEWRTQEGPTSVA